MRRASCAGPLALLVLFGSPAGAQFTAGQGVPPHAFTRVEAVATAIMQSTRHTIARVDVASASAQLSTVKQFENPTMSTMYSVSAPRAHVTLDVPMDWPGIRHARIAAARAQFAAATVRLELADVLLAFATDTAYTRAQTLDAQARLLAVTSREADSLLALVRIRRDAGDASNLDVEIAAVAAGQFVNRAVSALASATAAILRLQLLMSVSPDSVRVVLADTIAFAVMGASALTSGQADSPVVSLAVSTTGTTLPVAVAALDLRAAEALVQLEHRRRIGAPSIALGVEAINPGGPGGLLPLVGVSIALPLFNRNRAAIARAESERQRGRALLLQAGLEQQADLQLAQSDARAARTRADNSLRLLTSAERIGALSLLAYREGATTLVSVLEAQRSARDARVQLLDDLASAQIAERLKQLLLLRIPPLS